MAFDQYELNPLGIKLDLTQFERFNTRLKAASPAVLDKVDAAVKTFGQGFYDRAFQNLSGSAHYNDQPRGRAGTKSHARSAARISAMRFSTEAVLNVRTGRLRGALIKREARLRVEVQDDVFYGAIHEGTPEEPGRYPWFMPALAAVGGEDGFFDAVDAALGAGLEAV